MSTHNACFYGEIRKNYSRIIIKYTSLTALKVSSKYPKYSNNIPDMKYCHKVRGSSSKNKNDELSLYVYVT